MTKFFSKLLFITSLLCFNTVFAVDYTNIKKYVNDLATSSSTILNDNKLTVSAKTAKCKILLDNNLDLIGMAKASLGRSSRNLTPNQQKQFNVAYHDYIVNYYSNLVKSYQGEKIQILKVEPISSNEYKVYTQIINPDSQKELKIDYIVHQIGSALKISNIIPEGIDMINSQQEQFTSILSSQGFDALITDLKNKD